MIFPGKKNVKNVRYLKRSENNATLLKSKHKNVFSPYSIMKKKRYFKTKDPVLKEQTSILI